MIDGCSASGRWRGSRTALAAASAAAFVVLFATPASAPADTVGAGPVIPDGGAAPGTVEPPTPQVTAVARILRPIDVRRDPHSRHAFFHLRTRATWGHGPVSLMVLRSMRVTDAQHPLLGRLWLRVALPIRPNGASGWIPADATRLRRVYWRVRISTEQRTVRVYYNGSQLRIFRAVVGKPSTPTPHGLFAINEIIRQVPTNGFLGPWALHLTAFSTVLDDYGGGPGRVAIHGRDGASLLDPLGTARSHGCIRITNGAVSYLHRTLPVGTPVQIS